MDFLYEECAVVSNPKSANTKFKFLKAISIIAYVLAIIWALIVFFVVEWPNVPLIIGINIVLCIIPLAFLIFAGYFFGKKKYNCYVEYDYILISGSIRISKVMRNVKRKDLIFFECRDIEKIGLYNSETYNLYENYSGIIKTVLTSNNEPKDNKDFYYFVVNTEGNKYLLIFECTEKFIINTLKFTSRTALEEELVK